MRRLRAGLALACALPLSACIATQQDVLGLSQQADDLKEQVSDLKKTVSSMQSNQADLSVQIKQLREDLTAYQETTRASMGNMDQLSAKLDALGAQLSGKVAQLGQTLSQAQQKGLEEQKAALDAQTATELLVAAEQRLKAKDYAQAAASLEDYLQRFPNGALADVATYDLGLARLGLKQWDKAGVQFATVLEKYPKSGQTPGARLRYAQCLLGLKRGGDEARAYLESVIADFPKSPEAKEASSELKRLPARTPKPKK